MVNGSNGVDWSNDGQHHQFHYYHQGKVSGEKKDTLKLQENYTRIWKQDFLRVII